MGSCGSERLPTHCSPRFRPRLLWRLARKANSATYEGCNAAAGGRWRPYTIHLDGDAVRSCVTTISDANGKSIATTAGLDPAGNHTLQEKGFREGIMADSTACARASRSAHCSAIGSSAGCTIFRSTWSSRRCAGSHRSPRPQPAAAAQRRRSPRSMVVDGLTLARLWQSNRTSVTAALDAVRIGTRALSADERTRIGRELDALVAAVDGLSDALTAEAAYQMARGNTSRVAATLKTVAQGDAPPPELEVIRTPRTGIALTHRPARPARRRRGARSGPAGDRLLGARPGS